MKQTTDHQANAWAEYERLKASYLEDMARYRETLRRTGCDEKAPGGGQTRRRGDAQ